MAKEMNVLAILKQSGERYVFLFDTESRGALLDQFAKFAKDPELSFSWLDAATLSYKIKKVVF